MVLHDHSYPLGHIVTVRFWHDVCTSDLHFTLSDTGWAKSAWGKFYGQWIEGAAIFVYDMYGAGSMQPSCSADREYGINTFCRPPTIYRMLILADLDNSISPNCATASAQVNPSIPK